jgi:nitric oxide reductase NorQ protein
MQTITPPVEDFRVAAQPFYLPVAGEVELFEHAHRCRLPVLLKGPTGTGKTRFVAYMAHRLGLPLVTVACHEDLTASDLVGRFLILGEETVWCDGPLTTALRLGAIVYLDEVVEARKDTLVVIHPLTDDRRMLPVEKLGQVLHAPDPFMMVISYNPGYQSILKELKQSTRQRFISMDFGFPPPEMERRIVIGESGLDEARAEALVRIAGKIRNLTDRGLEEGVSTRLVVYAARLMVSGAPPREAAAASFSRTLTDDADLRRAIDEVISDFL